MSFFGEIMSLQQILFSRKKKETGHIGRRWGLLPQLRKFTKWHGNRCMTATIKEVEYKTEWHWRRNSAILYRNTFLFICHFRYKTVFLVVWCCPRAESWSYLNPWLFGKIMPLYQVLCSKKNEIKIELETLICEQALCGTRSIFPIEIYEY